MKKLARPLLEWLRADHATLPVAAPVVERAALVVVVLATLWFGLAAGWEIAAPFAAGHYAAATAVATAGENMWRWGVLGAVTHYTVAPPQNGDFYCHHPWGIFWTAALFVKTFGHHAWVCRLPAVLMSTSMPLLLYAGGRALWGPVAGAAAALAFTVVPIAVAFANFHALEVPVMFGMAVAIWGYVRLGQSGRRRWWCVALFGLIFAVHADWAGFVFGALLLAGLFVRGFVLRRWFPPLPFRRFASFWAWAACLCLASALFYLAAFQSLGQLEQFLRQGEFRSTGAEKPLGEVLAARKGWLETSFTPLVIAVGKLAAPVLALRLALLRREGEWLPLAVLGAASFQYLVFKQGADVHFFWPHYFALYFAYGLGALSATLEAAASRIRRLRPAAPFVALAAAAVLGAALAPDAVRALAFARKTGGRFNEKGSIIHPDLDKAAALELVASRMKPGHGLLLHPGMKQSYWMDWVTQRPVRSARLPRAGSGDRYLMVDARFATADELGPLLAAHQPLVIGPFWFVDRSQGHAPLTALAIERREPGPFESYFVLGSHALRTIEPDPWAAWELAHHYGSGDVPAPSSRPRSPESLRAAHNHALASGDTARAAALLAELLRGTDASARCRYDDGTELLGVRFERGTSDVLTVYLQAGASSGRQSRRFGIESIVETPPDWSLVGADPVVRDVGMPPVVAASRWKAGYVYSTVTEVLKRPGRERFVGGFRGEGAPEPQGCSPEQTLLVLE